GEARALQSAAPPEAWLPWQESYCPPAIPSCSPPNPSQPSKPAQSRRSTPPVLRSRSTRARRRPPNILRLSRQRCSVAPPIRRPVILALAIRRPITRTRAQPHTRTGDPTTTLEPISESAAGAAGSGVGLSACSRASARLREFLLLPGGLLFPAVADQNARHAVIPFMTGRIEDPLPPVVGLSPLEYA